MSKPISSYYDATKYLGQFVGEQEPFLKDTACMSPEMRIAMAAMKAGKEKFKDDKELLELIAEAELFIRYFGFAMWQRDTVTDMALKKANPQEIETFEDQDDKHTPETNNDTKEAV